MALLFVCTSAVLPLSLCSHRTPFHLQCLAAEYRATDEAPTFDRRLKYSASQMRRISVSRMGSMPSRRSCSAMLSISAVRSVIFIVYFYCLLCVAVCFDLHLKAESSLIIISSISTADTEHRRTLVKIQLLQRHYETRAPTIDAALASSSISSLISSRGAHKTRF